jgi:hypothetical protein
LLIIDCVSYCFLYINKSTKDSVAVFAPVYRFNNNIIKAVCYDYGISYFARFRRHYLQNRTEQKRQKEKKKYVLLCSIISKLLFLIKIYFTGCCSCGSERHTQSERSAEVLSRMQVLRERINSI